MPIGFPTDSSPQGGGTFTSGSTFYPTVNQLKLDTTSNTLKTYIDTKQNTLTSATTLLGVGSSITALNYNNITLNLPSTFPSDWSTLGNKPTTFNPDTTNIYTKTQTDTLLAAKQATLTATTTLSGVGSNLTLINYNALSNLPNLSQYALNSALSSYQLLLTATTTLSGIGSNLTLINYNTLSNLPNLALKENVLTFNAPLSRTANTISLDLSTYLTSNSASNIFNTIANTTTSLATKESILTFNAPLTRSVNTISLDLSTYLTSNNASNIFDTIAARNAALASYLTTATAGTTYLTQTNAASTYQPKITTYTLSPAGTATFNSGTLTFDLSAYQTSASLGTTYLKLDGTNTMTGALSITSSAVSNQLVLTNTATAGYTSIKFYNGTQNGYIGLGGTTLSGTYQANLFIETTNSIIFATGGYNTANTPPRMILSSSGNLGIGTTNPNSFMLNVNGTSGFQNSVRICGSIGNAGSRPAVSTSPIAGEIRGTGTTLGGDDGFLRLSAGGYTSANVLTFIDLSGYSTVGDMDRNIVFSTAAAERMRISSGGNVNITNSLSIAGNQIQDYLFNNLGGNHGDTTDYNVSTFGCKFVLGTANEPSTVYGSQHSSYTMFMGLGANYPASQFGCQLAIPRNKTNAAISVRFKENSSWGGWSQITAGNLFGTANFTYDVWQYSTDGQQRLFFGNNSTTYIQGQGGTPIIFRNNANQDLGNISSGGDFTASSSMTANRYYCSSFTVSASTVLTGGVNLNGFFVGMNNWWYKGYSYLTVSLSFIIANNNGAYWNGRIFLSPDNRFGSGTPLTYGGILGIVTDLQSPTSGNNAYIQLEERWDGNGNNYLRVFSQNLLSAMALSYSCSMIIKIYG